MTDETAVPPAANDAPEAPPQERQPLSELGQRRLVEFCNTLTVMTFQSFTDMDKGWESLVLTNAANALGQLVGLLYKDPASSQAVYEKMVERMANSLQVTCALSDEGHKGKVLQLINALNERLLAAAGGVHQPSRARVDGPRIVVPGRGPHPRFPRR